MTHLENLRRSGPNQNAGKTHCKWGHELSGSNLYVNPTTKKRACKACARRASREYNARRQAAEQI